MDLDKEYCDSNDVPRNILGMVKHEPEWAANRIQEGERYLSEVFKITTILEEIKSLNRCRNDTEAYLLELCEYALGNSDTKPNRSDYGFKS